MQIKVSTKSPDQATDVGLFCTADIVWYGLDTGFSSGIFLNIWQRPSNGASLRVNSSRCTRYLTVNRYSIRKPFYTRKTLDWELVFFPSCLPTMTTGALFPLQSSIHDPSYARGLEAGGLCSLNGLVENLSILWPVENEENELL